MRLHWFDQSSKLSQEFIDLPISKAVNQSMLRPLENLFIILLCSRFMYKYIK